MVKSCRRRPTGSTRREAERYPERPHNYTPPPPPPGNDDSWELQFCKWWGWNWVKKENLEITKFQQQQPKFEYDCYGPMRSLPPSSLQPPAPQPQKRVDRNSNCLRDFCSCLFSKNRKASESLQKLYSTPSNSIIYQEAVSCGVKDRGVESFSCLEVHRNISRSANKECKCKQKSMERSRCRCTQKSQERECKCSRQRSICRCKQPTKEDSTTSTTTQEDNCLCSPPRKPSDDITCKCRCCKLLKQLESKKADRPSQTKRQALITTHAQTNETQIPNKNKKIKKCGCVHVVCHCCCHCCCDSTTSTEDPEKPTCKCNACICCKCKSAPADKDVPNKNNSNRKDRPSTSKSVPYSTSEKIICVCEESGEYKCPPSIGDNFTSHKKISYFTSKEPLKCEEIVPCKDYPPYQEIHISKTQLKQEDAPSTTDLVYRESKGFKQNPGYPFYQDINYSTCQEVIQDPPSKNKIESSFTSGQLNPQHKAISSDQNSLNNKSDVLPQCSKIPLFSQQKNGQNFQPHIQDTPDNTNKNSNQNSLLHQPTKFQSQDLLSSQKQSYQFTKPTFNTNQKESINETSSLHQFPKFQPQDFAPYQNKHRTNLDQKESFNQKYLPLQPQDFLSHQHKTYNILPCSNSDQKESTNQNQLAPQDFSSYQDMPHNYQTSSSSCQQKNYNNLYTQEQLRPSYPQSPMCRCYPSCQNPRCKNRYIDQKDSSFGQCKDYSPYQEALYNKQNTPSSPCDCAICCPNSYIHHPQKKPSNYQLGDCKCPPYFKPSLEKNNKRLNVNRFHKKYIQVPEENVCQKNFSKFGAPSQKYPHIQATKSDILDKYYSKKINEEFFNPRTEKIYDLSSRTPQSLDDYKTSTLPDPIEVDEDIKYLENLEERVKTEMKSRLMLDVVCDAILFKNNCKTFETESTVLSKYSNSQSSDIKPREKDYFNSPLTFENHFMEKIEAVVKKLVKNYKTVESDGSDTETNSDINVKRTKRVGSPVSTESKRFKAVEKNCFSSDESFSADVSDFNHLFEKMDEITKKSRVNVAKIQGVIKSFPHPKFGSPRKSRSRSPRRRSNNSEIMETLHEVVMNTNIGEQVVQSMFDIIKCKKSDTNLTAISEMSENGPKNCDNLSENWSSLSSRSKTLDDNTLIENEFRGVDETMGEVEKKKRYKSGKTVKSKPSRSMIPIKKQPKK